VDVQTDALGGTRFNVAFAVPDCRRFITVQSPECSRQALIRVRDNPSRGEMCCEQGNLQWMLLKVLILCPIQQIGGQVLMMRLSHQIENQAQVESRFE